MVFVVGGVLISAFSSKLPVYLQTLGVWAGVLIVLVGAVGIIFHLVREVRGAKLGISPMHIIIIGLCGVAISTLVAAGGIIWQARRSTSSINTDQNSQGIHKITKTSEIQPEKVATLLRLQFKGGQQAPTEIRSENVLSWYVIWSGEITITSYDKDNKPTEHKDFPKTWIIVIVFDRPVLMRQLLVEPGAPEFPRYEVKVAGANYAIVTTLGENPPAGILDIYTKD
jgi:hypothetical protein